MTAEKLEDRLEGHVTSINSLGPNSAELDGEGSSPPSIPPPGTTLPKTKTSTTTNLGEVVVQVKGLGVRNGVSPQLLDKLCRPITTSTTLQSALDYATRAGILLRQLGIAKKVTVVVDALDPKDSSVSPSSAGVGAVIILNVEPSSRIMAKTGIDVGNVEGSMVASLTLRNCLTGRGEVLEAQSSMGSESPFAETISSPLLAKVSENSHMRVRLQSFIHDNPNQTCALYGDSSCRSRKATLAYDEWTKRIGTEIKGTLGQGGLWGIGAHELAYELSWREICNVDERAPWSVRRHAGHSLKSALLYQYSIDARDNPMLPNRGFLLRFHSELAGLLGVGDMKFAKTRVTGQYILPIIRDHVSLSLGVQGGGLWGSKYTLSDAFLAGGPLSVRGFKLHGIGPRNTDSAIPVGGNAFWTAGLSLLFSLPKLDANYIKGHVFCNAGALRNMETVTSMQEWITSPSVSAGLGIAVRFSMFRLELNWSLPLQATSCDVVAPGLQFGIGMDFSS